MKTHFIKNIFGYGKPAWTACWNISKTQIHQIPQQLWGKHQTWPGWMESNADREIEDYATYADDRENTGSCRSVAKLYMW